MPSILCLGDSMVQGREWDPTGFRSFRGPLQTLLASAGVAGLDFIGPQSDTPASGGTDPNHAGWGGNTIDNSSGAFSGQNLADRIPGLKTAYPSPDLIIVSAPWNDLYNQPTNLASRYATYITSTVQSGAWASVPLVMLTFHPEPGRTDAEMQAAYDAYRLTNAQIRSLANSSRFVADLATLTGGNQQAFLERIIARAQAAPEVTTVLGGGSLPNVKGGHKVTSWQSIADFNAQWSTSPPFVNDVMGASPASKDFNASAVVGGINTFLRDVQAAVPWFWVWCAPGHASTNTCIEVRNGFGMALHQTQGWRFFFQGARMGGPNGSDNAYVSTPGGAPATGTARQGWRSDGITSWVASGGNQGIEVWPADTAPSRGIVGYYGGLNRELFINSRCFLTGVQARLALIDPNGPDDRGSARFVVTCGVDFTTSYSRDPGRYDRYSFPLTVMDGGSDAWEVFRATDWTPVTCITIGRTTPGNGFNADEHYEDPGLSPPLGNWSPATPYNNIGTYSISVSTLRGNPPPLPVYWEGSGGAGSGWNAVDFWINPATGNRDAHWLQSGADKAAGVISRTIIASNVFGGGGGGGGGGGEPIVYQPLLGLPTKPNVFARTEAGKVAVAAKNWDTSFAPGWPPTVLLPAIVGAAYNQQISAVGSPAPTYSIVSGPAWLTCSPLGFLGGTPVGFETSNIVVIRATNSVDSADLTVPLQVFVPPAITTTSLPNAQQGASYRVQLEATGSGPQTWSATGLPAGLSLSATGVLSGVPLSAGTASIAVELDAAAGMSALRTLPLVIDAAGVTPAPTDGDWVRLDRDVQVWIRVPRA